MAGQAGWYWQLNVVRYFTSAPGAGWNGPYATKAAAASADSGGITGGTGGVGGGVAGNAWYVVTIRRTPQTPFTVEVMQKPFPSGAGVTVLIDHTGGVSGSGYATQAEAQAAADQYKNQIVPGVKALGSTPDWQQLMVRIGEALLGIVLIGIGLARITGAQNAVSSIAKARIP